MIEVFEERCEVEGLTGAVSLQFGEGPGDLTCERAKFRNADADGSSIDWLSAPTSRDPLDCDLNGDCCLDFTADICPFLNEADLTSTLGKSGDYVGLSDGTSELELDFPDPDVGADADDTHSLQVEAEYTAHPCPEETCPFYLGHLLADGDGAVWEIKISKVIRKEISNLQVELVQPVLGVWSPLDGATAFQEGALALRVQFDLEGPVVKTDDGHYDLIVTNEATVGTFTDGAFSLVTSFPVDEGTGTLTLDVQPALVPPVAALNLPATLECDAWGGWVSDDSLIASFDPDAGVLFDVLVIDGAFSLPGTLVPLGAHSFSVRSENDRGAATLAPPEEVSIVDTTPPVLGDAADVTVSSCTDDLTVTVTPPAASDICTPVVVTGVVTEVNGAPAAIPVVGNQVVLPVGTHTVTWTATDDAGNDAVTTSSVTVLPAVAALQELRLADRANTEALLASYGTTEVGADATSGSVLSDDRVWLRSRATVEGDVTTGGALDQQQGATVTGQVATFAAVPLAPLNLALTGPLAGAAAVVVNSGDVRSLPPGQYGQVIVNANAQLELESGAYGFQNLTVNQGATLEHGDTLIRVAQEATLRGTQVATGALSLEIAGGGWSHLESALVATVIVPQGTLRLAGHGGPTYTGRWIARDLLIEADTSLICD